MSSKEEKLRKKRALASKKRKKRYIKKTSEAFLKEKEKEKFIEIYNKLRSKNINHPFLKKYNLMNLTEKNCKTVIGLLIIKFSLWKRIKGKIKKELFNNSFFLLHLF